MADIAVIVPAYNPGPVLRRALDSVLRQTCQVWECIVIDDGSVEDLSWVSAIDERIRMVRQANAGTSVARNVGASLTSSPFIAWLDQDDEWLPSKLERQSAFLRMHADVVLVDTATYITKDGIRTAQDYPQHHGSYLELLAGGNMVLSSVMARRSAVEAAGGFSPMFRIVQDADLYLRMAMLGGGLSRLPERLTVYHLHARNTSKDLVTLQAEHGMLMAQHTTRAVSLNEPDTLQAIAAGKAFARALLGAQWFDEFRSRRRASDLMRALSLNHHLVLASMVKGAARCVARRQAG